MARRWRAAWLACLWPLCGLAAQPRTPGQKRLLAELRASGFKLLYESCRDGNWELMLAHADGSSPVNLTKTPDADELFPHASPDGTRVVFVADSGKGKARARHAWLMNLDGTDRVQIGEHGRQPFWSPDADRIAYLKGNRLTYREGGKANRELRVYDLATKQHTRHPRNDTAGLLNPCWAPDGRWIVASAMGAAGFGHSIVALEADGTRAVELARSGSEAKSIYQCRPDVSPDGRHVAWGKEDVDNHYGLGRRTMFIEVADIHFDGPQPRIANRRYVLTVKAPLENYHVDWSPDGQYIAFAQGCRGKGRMAKARYVVGVQAPGWDIWVVKPSQPGLAVQITHDGLSNKEPDWVPARTQGKAETK